jgi:transposase
VQKHELHLKSWLKGRTRSFVIFGRTLREYPGSTLHDLIDSLSMEGRRSGDSNSNAAEGGDDDEDDEEEDEEESSDDEDDDEDDEEEDEEEESDDEDDDEDDEEEDGEEDEDDEDDDEEEEAEEEDEDEEDEEEDDEEDEEMSREAERASFDAFQQDMNVEKKAAAASRRGKVHEQRPFLGSLHMDYDMRIVYDRVRRLFYAVVPRARRDRVPPPVATAPSAPTSGASAGATTSDHVASVDPGVSTFLTLISNRGHAMYIGAGSSVRLGRLAWRLSKVQSEKDQATSELQGVKVKLANMRQRAEKEPTKKQKHSKVECQHLASEQRRLKRVIYLTTRRLASLWRRRDNLLDDLHRRIVRVLLTTYDKIVIPPLDVQRLSQRSDGQTPAKTATSNGGGGGDSAASAAAAGDASAGGRGAPPKRRRINAQTAQSMLDLSHGLFRSRLLNAAREYGGVRCDDGGVRKEYGGVRRASDRVLVLSEAWTTQMCGGCGAHRKIGGSRVYRCNQGRCGSGDPPSAAHVRQVVNRRLLTEADRMRGCVRSEGFCCIRVQVRLPPRSELSSQHSHPCAGAVPAAVCAVAVRFSDRRRHSLLQIRSCRTAVVESAVQWVIGADVVVDECRCRCDVVRPPYRRQTVHSVAGCESPLSSSAGMPCSPAAADAAQQSASSLRSASD